MTDDKLETDARPSEQETPATDQSTPRKNRFSFHVLLTGILVLVTLALCVAFGLSWQQYQQLETAYVAERGEWQGQLSQQQKQLNTLDQQHRQALSEVTDKLNDMAKDTAASQQQYHYLQDTLASLSGASRLHWQMAEAESLLRLANHQLLMASDVKGALRLFEQADTLLEEDLQFFQIRGAIAENIQQLRAVPITDISGTYLHIQALISRVDELLVAKPRVLDVTEASSAETSSPVSEVLWRELKSLFRPVQFDAPIQPVAGPDQQFLLRQNLRLLLEHAQLALLRQEDQPYRLALQEAEGYLTVYFQRHQSRERWLQELEALADVTVKPELPDVSRSLTLLLQHRRQGLRLPAEVEKE